MVPLQIVAVLFSIGISVTITGAFWVKGVNDHLELIDKRFSRVEVKLGIDEVSARPPETSLDFISRAETQGRVYESHLKKKER